MCSWGIQNMRLRKGAISFKGKDITAESADKAGEGRYVPFFPGTSGGCRSFCSNFIRSALQQKKGGYVRLWDFKKELKKNLEFLDLDESYAERSLNVGFSGGEKKKIETPAPDDAPPESCNPG